MNEMKIVKCAICGYTEKVTGRQYWNSVRSGNTPTVFVCDTHRQEW